MPTPKPDENTIHGRLQQARLVRKLSQEAMANHVGKSVSAWARIERGETELRLKDLTKANELLRLDVRYFFGKIPLEDAYSPNLGLTPAGEVAVQRLNKKASQMKKKIQKAEYADVFELLDDLNRTLEKVWPALARTHFMIIGMVWTRLSSMLSAPSEHSEE